MTFDRFLTDDVFICSRIRHLLQSGRESGLLNAVYTSIRDYSYEDFMVKSHVVPKPLIDRLRCWRPQAWRLARRYSLSHIQTCILILLSGTQIRLDGATQLKT